jgi:hypothetical protein
VNDASVGSDEPRGERRTAERRAGALRLPRTTILLVLLASAGCLLGMSVLVKVVHLGWGYEYFFGLNRLFWVDAEANVPTWFSSSLLLASAIGLAIVAMTHLHRRGLAVQWAVLALLLLLLAIDEVAGIHEITARMAARSGGLGAFRGDASSFAWVLFAAPVVLATALLFLPFVGSLARPVRQRMAWGTGIFVTGVLGIEALTGLLVGLNPDTWSYLVLATLEEGCEMLGAIIFLDGVLLELRDRVGPITLQIT